MTSRTDTTAGLRPASSAVAVMATSADRERHAMRTGGEPWCQRFDPITADTTPAPADTGITCVRCLVLLVAEHEIDPAALVGYLEEICR